MIGKSVEWVREPEKKDPIPYQHWIKKKMKERNAATKLILEDCRMICSLQKFKTEGFTLVPANCRITKKRFRDVYTFWFINKKEKIIRFVSIERGIFGFVEKTKSVQVKDKSPKPKQATHDEKFADDDTISN